MFLDTVAWRAGVRVPLIVIDASSLVPGPRLNRVPDIVYDLFLSVLPYIRLRRFYEAHLPRNYSS